MTTTIASTVAAIRQPRESVTPGGAVLADISLRAELVTGMNRATLWEVRATKHLGFILGKRIVCNEIYAKEGGFGWTATDERNHPDAANCPLGWLDDVDATCPAWRAEVRAAKK